MPTLEQIESDLGFAPQPAPNEATAAFPPVTLPVLASALGLTVRAVNQLAVAGCVVKLSHGQYDFAASIRNYIEKLRAKDFTEKDRLTAAQADIAELKLAEARRELVPASQVDIEWAGIVRDATAAMLGATAKIQGRLGHLSNHDASVIDSEIRAALTSLGEEPANV
jgi:terminase small subunit / prophage DNA-packing protein